MSSVSIDDPIELKCQAGFQMFAFEGSFGCFRMEATLELLEEGKTGIIFRLDRRTHDGYFISLDLFKGVAQLRAWGSGPDGSGEDMMQFKTLQAGYWAPEQRGRVDLRVIAYGSYLELAVGDRVLLSLADQTFQQGSLGFYVESTRVRVSDLSLEHFESPVQSDEQLANG
ncbi:hypothetical protein [Neorhodopirellula pilleata]|uniref:hypothetical protein n=1 Tax=Neorhodopirellula pilleata TaxID=2714738 RepID=UPI001E3F2D16|nr:hypothetical protein [Neorhodopirellula pilleata]